MTMPRTARTRTKQTLAQALELARTGKDRDLQRAARILHGLPEGGWGETQEAMRELEGHLPFDFQRDYTVAQFVAAAYTVSSGPTGFAGRYESRFTEEA